MNVLFPLDGSEATYQALERGLGFLASDSKIRATFLVVLSKGLLEMPKEAREHLEYDDEDEIFLRDDEAKAVIQKGQAIATRLRVKDVRGLVLTGRVKDTILAEAAKHDVLVMHGLSRDEKAEKRRGSALEEIARNAPCSVLLVRA